MTSRELNEILNKTRRTPNISLTPEQVEEIINKLEILEILKEHLIVDYEYDHIYIYKDEIDFSIEFNSCLTDKEKNTIKEWLDGK